MKKDFKIRGMDPEVIRQLKLLGAQHGLIMPKLIKWMVSRISNEARWPSKP